MNARKKPLETPVFPDDELERNLAESEEREVRAILHEKNSRKHREPSPDSVINEMRSALKAGYSDDFDDF
jgi:hypothetical protein